MTQHKGVSNMGSIAPKTARKIVNNYYYSIHSKANRSEMTRAVRLDWSELADIIRRLRNYTNDSGDKPYEDGEIQLMAFFGMYDRESAHNYLSELNDLFNRRESGDSSSNTIQITSESLIGKHTLIYRFVHDGTIIPAELHDSSGTIITTVNFGELCPPNCELAWPENYFKHW